MLLWQKCGRALLFVGVRYLGIEAVAWHLGLDAQNLGYRSHITKIDAQLPSLGPHFFVTQERTSTLRGAGDPHGGFSV